MIKQTQPIYFKNTPEADKERDAKIAKCYWYSLACPALEFSTRALLCWIPGCLGFTCNGCCCSWHSQCGSPTSECVSCESLFADICCGNCKAARNGMRSHIMHLHERKRLNMHPSIVPKDFYTTEQPAEQPQEVQQS